MSLKKTGILLFVDAQYFDSALEWTRTTTPLGTGPQPAAYTIPPRGQISVGYYGRHNTRLGQICQQVFWATFIFLFYCLPACSMP